MVNLNHLEPDASVLAMLPGVERLARLKMERWIGYTRANQALAQLETLLSRFAHFTGHFSRLPSECLVNYGRETK